MSAVTGVGAHAVNLCVGPINVACSAAKGVVGTAGQGLLDVVADAVGAAARSVIDGMTSALNASTTVDFGASWFSAQTKVMAIIALPLVTVFFLLQVIASAVRREPGGLVRAGAGLVKALVAGAAAIPILQLTLVACDQMCGLLIGSSHGGMAGLARRLFAAGVVVPAGGPVLAVVVGCWAIAAAFVLWGVLLFRKALLLVTGSFTLLAFAGSGWDATRGWVRKWTETAAVLVFSKLVIVVILVTGINALGLSGPGESSGATLSDVFSGLLLVSIATLAPWLCWKFVHWSGTEIAHDLHHTIAGSPLPRAARKAGRAATSVAAGAATRGATAAAAAAFRRPPQPPGPPAPPTPPPAPAGAASRAGGR